MRDETSPQAGQVVKFAEALRRAGISKLVLHAWERRFSVQLCERTDTGRRFMTELQVERLRLLKLCTDAGFRIGSIIGLPDEELLRIADRHSLRLDLCETLDAVRRLDAASLTADLERRLGELGPVAFALRVVSPLMEEIGRRWHDGTLSIAAEHLASVEARRILASCLNDIEVPSGAVKAVATTPEGELHELGALMIAILSRSRGIDTLYLGPNLPNEEIASSVRRCGAGVVFLSCLASPRRALSSQLVALRDLLPADVTIFAGGPAVQEMMIDGVDILFDMQNIDAFLLGLTSRVGGGAVCEGGQLEDSATGRPSRVL